MRTARAITAELHAVQLDLAAQTRADALVRLRADPQVEYAEPDQRRYPHAVPPNDPLFLQQWYLQNPTTGATPSAIDAITAWNTTTGSAALVIADLDTGVRFDHPDLLAAASGGRLLPGYNFIGDSFIANDGGGGRDADASDPGDWITQQDSTHIECSNLPKGTQFPVPSSWHGTRVSGILGALTGNGTGIAGVTWQTQILPVRVLGVCGGLDSDIIAGMLWSAGIAVAGAPANTTPAKIVNMSLGGSGNCPVSYQDALDQLRALGVLVVVSAGNEGGFHRRDRTCHQHLFGSDQPEHRHELRRAAGLGHRRPDGGGERQPQCVSAPGASQGRLGVLPTDFGGGGHPAAQVPCAGERDRPAAS